LKLETKIEKFTNPLYLESGRILEPYQIAYETYGKLNEDKSNVIIICHALAGNHHCAGKYENDRKAGWWDDLIGDGKTVDTTKYFVICTNVISSCYGSTGPMSPNYPSVEPFRFDFPVVTIKDMVKAQKILFNSLGIYKVCAVIGGSMGGMQALELAVNYPTFAKETIVLASTAKTRDWAIAFNKVTQEAILKDPDFKDGFYEPEYIKQHGLNGLAIGRMAGHISFLSPHSMHQKFKNEYVKDDGLFDLFGKHQVERYLEYNTYRFVKEFDPLSYLYIIKAINIFDLSRGFDSLEDALSQVQTNLTLVGFESDLLFMPYEMEEVHNIMIKIGKENQSRYIHIDSDYGHDAFLVEVDKFEKYIKELL
jgi:homoserine O-acetyltransferase